MNEVRRRQPRGRRLGPQRAQQPRARQPQSGRPPAAAAAQVVDAFGEHFHGLEVTTEAGWALVTGVRNGAAAAPVRGDAEEKAGQLY